MDDARSGADQRGSPASRDEVRFGILLALMAAGGIWMVLEGLGRTGADRVVLLVLALLVLLGLLVLAVLVLRRRRLDRRLAPEERAAARAARYEEARRARPAWLDSRGFQVVTVLFAAYWTYLLVVGAMAGVWRQVVTAGLFLALSGWTALRVQRNRTSAGR